MLESVDNGFRLLTNNRPTNHSGATSSGIIPKDMDIIQKYKNIYQSTIRVYSVPRKGMGLGLWSFVFLLNIIVKTLYLLKRKIICKPRPLKFIKRNRVELGVFTLVFCIWYYFCLPAQLFQDPISTVVLDRNGNLLGARIAADGQWRFPHNNDVPEKFEKAILCFEDKRFYDHIGIDFLALSRALFSNVSQNEIVSGASTITMQVIRLSRKNPPRTYLEKVKEMIMATRLELRSSKSEILSLYTSNAPFGGNVVGLDAASWKYFGRSPEQLSWAESATLAVLPNCPGLIHPGRNRDKLEEKRNRLLKALFQQHEIDSVTYQLALLEELPEKPVMLANNSPHLTERIQAQNKGKVKALFNTTIDQHIQQRTAHIVDRHSVRLSENSINNAAAIVVEVETGDVIAYVGNSKHKLNKARSVDLITAPRSTGSILKPFLYATMLQNGDILPQTIVPDVPTFYGSYSPTNFYPKYDGAVPADNALARSLNIPAVRMLSQYGVEKFHNDLNDIGLTTLNKPSSHYGLSLILGGGETTLWDLSRAYSGMARNLIDYKKLNANYRINAFGDLHFIQHSDSVQKTSSSIIEAPAIWHTFNAMLEVVRPGVEGNWETFNPNGKVAWKTGTSFGHRDAWAVGCTPKYVVAVWAGNADGQGRPGLTGTSVAAPILFEIFDAIGKGDHWFDEPHHHMVPVEVCKHSGHLVNAHCSSKKSLLVPRNGLKSGVCPYCRPQFLDPSESYLVNSDCVNPADMKKRTFFILPTAMEYYYKKKHPDYEVLPPVSAQCSHATDKKDLQIIYPKNNSKIYVPVNLDGTVSSTVFQVTHRDAETKIHWHLDEQYIGTTSYFHELALNPTTGMHILTIVDEKGESIQRRFEVISGKG